MARRLGNMLYRCRAHFYKKVYTIFLTLAFIFGFASPYFPDGQLGNGTRYAEASSHAFIENFIWQGDHGATVNNGASNTVWWNAHNWSNRQDTSSNSVSYDVGDHIDIHTSTSSLSDGTATNDRYKIGGDGGAGVGIMHLDFETIESARLRNPMLISPTAPGVVEFRAPRFVTTGHWWEIAIIPTNMVTGGEFTAVPCPGTGAEGFNDNPGSGHCPPQDSINFIIIGSTDYEPCLDWKIEMGVAKAINGVKQDYVSQIQVATNPSEKNELYAWRLEYYPDKIKVFADFDENGVKEQVDVFNVSVPWSEVYVNLLGVAYEADHHPQNGTTTQCTSYQGQVREMPWKEVKVSPVKYSKTRAYPKENGIEHTPITTGWVGYDTRDTQRFGSVNGVPQPNAFDYDDWGSVAFCSSGWYCNSPTSSKTLSFNLPAEDAAGISSAALLFDTRFEGDATLKVNGTPIGSLAKRSTVPGYTSDTHWVQRSIAVNPSLFVAGTNTITVDIQGQRDFDRLQFEFGYAENVADTTPPTRSNGQPIGTLPAGTATTTLGLDTNENATCKYATISGTAYDSMLSIFASTGGTKHQNVITGLQNGISYNYYVKCKDAASNKNIDDYTIAFSVASPGPKIIDVRVGASSDDAYSDPDSWPSYSHNDVARGIFAGNPGNSGQATWGGFRWTNLGIPAGAIINNAYVELVQKDWGFSGITTLAFEGASSPAAFSSLSTPYNRWASKTAWNVQWNWDSQKGSPGKIIKTPALVNGVQELVNRYGAINTIVLLEDGTGYAGGQYHSWESYDNGVNVAPRLHIEYTQ